MGHRPTTRERTISKALVSTIYSQVIITVCPTEGWIYYVATNTFTEKDNGQPFLTTYQCKADCGLQLRKALWKIEKRGDYYTIKNVYHDKYIVYNGQISNANASRYSCTYTCADVTTPGDSELFVIGTNTAGNIVFSPKNESTTNFFNVCQGNINDLAGSALFNGKAKMMDQLVIRKIFMERLVYTRIRMM